MHSTLDPFFKKDWDLSKRNSKKFHKLKSNGIFNNLPLIAPTGVYLDSLAFKDSAINLDGKSEANYRVASLMRNIEQRAWLGTPSIRSIVALPDKQADMELSKFQLNFAVNLGLPSEKKEAK